MKRLVLPLAGCLAAGSVLAFPERPIVEHALSETAQALTSLAAHHGRQKAEVRSPR